MLQDYHHALRRGHDAARLDVKATARQRLGRATSRRPRSGASRSSTNTIRVAAAVVSSAACETATTSAGLPPAAQHTSCP